MGSKVDLFPICGDLCVDANRHFEKFGAIMAKVPMISMLILPFEPLWMSARKGALEVGSAAPDFSLPTLDGSRAVSLSAEVRERPVVLIFGSYT